MLKICLFGCVKCVYLREPSKIGESLISHKIGMDIQKGSVEDCHWASKNRFVDSFIITTF